MRMLVIAFMLVTAAMLAMTDPSSAQVANEVRGAVCPADEAGHGYETYPYKDPDGAGCYGYGVPGAVVTISGGPVPGGVTDRNTTTTADGSFTFTNVPDGSYTITAERVGFETASADVVVPGDGSRLFVAGKQVDQRFLVVGDQQQPVADALVAVCCTRTGEDTARTGADGTVSLSFTAGWRDIRVEAPGHLPNHTVALLDGAAALRVQIEPVPPPDAHVAGRVVDQDGTPVVDARIHAYSSGGARGGYDGGAPEPMPTPEQDGRAEPDVAYPYHGSGDFTFTDAQGRYRIGVYAGHVSIQAQKDGHAPAWAELDVARGQEASLDLELPRYPEKTARLVGTVVDDATDDPIRNINVQIHSPRFGLRAYSCGADEPRPMPLEEEPADEEGQASGDAVASSTVVYPAGGCEIETRAGAFEGQATPGYSIVRVSHDQWSSCRSVRDADGRTSEDCGPEYLPWVQTLVLQSGENRLDIRLRQRAAPDAVLSGYAVDKAAGAGIPDARVSFSHLEGGGYGWATTDDDGSYRIRLRSGPHEIEVWAEGYLRWAGTVDVAGGAGDFDIPMQEGQEPGHGCCWAYGVAYAADERAVAQGEGGGMAGGDGSIPAGAPAPDAGSEDAAGDGAVVSYEDLGGGLGPYDAAKRPAAGIQQEAEDTPGPAPLAVGAALLVLACVGRRRRHDRN